MKDLGREWRPCLLHELRLLDCIFLSLFTLTTFESTKEDKKYFECIKPLHIRSKKNQQSKIQQKIVEETINSKLFSLFHCWLNVSCVHKGTTWTSGWTRAQVSTRRFGLLPSAPRHFAAAHWTQTCWGSSPSALRWRRAHTIVYLNLLFWTCR